MDTSRVAVEQRLVQFRQRCVELGFSLTPQRLAIYELLAGDASHPSAEEIFRRIKPAMPSLSLGTVYRTLELLEDHGFIARLPADGLQARYDADLDVHPHLVCVRCRRVFDFHAADLVQVSLPEIAPNGFRIHGYQLQISGLCADCQTE